MECPLALEIRQNFDQTWANVPGAFNRMSWVSDDLLCLPPVQEHLSKFGTQDPMNLFPAGEKLFFSHFFEGHIP